MFRRRNTPGFTGFCGKAPPGGPSGGQQCVARQVQRLGAVRLRDAGVADQHVSQTAVCDRPARAPSDQRRRVSYPVSDSMSCRRRAPGPVPRAERALRRARTDALNDRFTGQLFTPTATRQGSYLEYRTLQTATAPARDRAPPPPPGRAPSALRRYQDSLSGHRQIGNSVVSQFGLWPRESACYA